MCTQSNPWPLQLCLAAIGIAVCYPSFAATTFKATASMLSAPRFEAAALRITDLALPYSFDSLGVSVESGAYGVRHLAVESFSVMADKPETCSACVVGLPRSVASFIDGDLGVATEQMPRVHGWAAVLSMLSLVGLQLRRRLRRDARKVVA